MSTQRLILTKGQDRPKHRTRVCVSVLSILLACLMPAGLAGKPLHVAPEHAVPDQVQAAAGQATAQTDAARQKELQADAARLLQLATQLKDNVDHTRKDELSLKVIREADEIEKLARAARSRIR